LDLKDGWRKEVNLKNLYKTLKKIGARYFFIQEKLELRSYLGGGGGACFSRYPFIGTILGLLLYCFSYSTRTAERGFKHI
jgi:hypothetical protein